MMEKPSLRDKILGVLEDGPLTTEDIAFSLEAHPATVKRLMSYLRRDGLVIQVPQKRTVRPPGTKHGVEWRKSS